LIGQHIVLVRSNLINFPSACPKCLEKADLATYTLKYEKKYLKNSYTGVTEKVQVNVPICKSCKQTLLATARKENAMLSAISTPILWGLVYVCFSFLGAANWHSFWVTILLVLAGTPVVAIWFVIKPESSRQVKWPVKLVGTSVFSFENEIYAKLFSNANPI
jgi:hypothetical protein